MNKNRRVRSTSHPTGLRLMREKVVPRLLGNSPTQSLLSWLHYVELNRKSGGRYILALAIVTVIGFSFSAYSNARGQTLDNIAESIGLTRKNGSLPFWKEPDLRALHALTGTVIDSEKSIMLVGHPEEGFGTAFVISQKHRLLATNAHIADMLDRAGSMYAIVNGSSKKLNVVRAWYHPAVRRIVSQSGLVTSADPHIGPVSPASRDVAVIQLDEGSEVVSQEMKLATPEEIRNAFAQPIGMLGFPGHDTKSWPGNRQAVKATFHQGVISRVTDFRFDASVGWQNLQFVQHTAASWNGFSGSPIFLTNGHVIAIHNMSRTANRIGESRSIAHGVRIDCLWELLIYHGLDEKVLLGEQRRQLVRLDKFEHILEEEKNLRKALAVLEQAELDGFRKRFTEAFDKCRQARMLAPNFPPTYNLRSALYYNYSTRLFEQAGYRQTQDSRRYLDYAEKDAKKYAQMAPSDPKSLIGLAAMFKARGFITGSQKLKRKAYDILTAVLSSENLVDSRAQALVVRASMRDEFDGRDACLADLNEAIEIADSTGYLSMVYEERARFWDGYGHSARGRADRKMAKDLIDRLEL